MNIYTIKTGITNNHLVCNGKKECILIDAGIPDKCGEIIKKINSYLNDRYKLQLIIITHEHYDHFGSLRCVKDYYDCKVLSSNYSSKIIENGELVLVNGFNKWGKFLIFISKFINSGSLNSCNIDIKIDKDYPLNNFGFDGKVIFTPGHTKGSLSIVMNNGDCFVGDLLMNGLPLTIGPSLSIFGYSKEEIKRSIEKLIKCGCRNFYPSHGNVIKLNEARRLVYGD